MVFTMHQRNYLKIGKNKKTDFDVLNYLLIEINGTQDSDKYKYKQNVNNK